MKFVCLATAVFAQEGSGEGSGVQCTGNEVLQNSVVECHADGMRDVIDQCALENLGNVPIDAARLGGSAYNLAECQGAYNYADNTVVFESNFGQCGTIRDSTETHLT